MAGTGDAGRAQDVLHPALVAEVPRHLLAHAFDPEAVPDVPERHLQLLEHPDHPVEPPDLSRRAPDPLDEGLAVEPVLHLPMTGERPVEVRRQRRAGILGDERQADVG